MNVFITSDPHIGHKNIAKYRENVDSTQANTDWFIGWWKQNVRKRDIVIILGDFVFGKSDLELFKNLDGEIWLMGGNHDELPAEDLLTVCAKLRGCMKYKPLGAWLSHFPMHPTELRGKWCIHGHTHYVTIDDPRYINVCCDHLQKTIGAPMVTIAQLREIQAKRKIDIV